MLMKVAIITERADVNLGGAERSVSELSSALRQENIDVTVIAAKGDEQAEKVKILCEDLPGSRVRFRQYEAKLLSLLCTERFDILHSVLPFDFADVYQPRGGSYAESIIRNAESYANPLVRQWKLRTHFFNLRRAELFKAERRLAERKSGPMIAALSDYVRRQFIEHYGTQASRIKVIPNAVDTQKSSQPEKSEKLRKKIYEKLGCDEKAVLFVFAANNFRLKGLRCLIESMGKIKQQQRDIDSVRICLVVAGSGRAGRYRNLAERLGVSENIYFAGRVDNIQNLLGFADAAVLPTYYDPASRFTLEAAANGVPVITTGYNGAAELFDDPAFAKIIDSPDDIEALAGAMHFFADPQNRRSAREQAHNLELKQKLSIKRHARQLAELYQHIIDTRKKKT